jgi:SAM-dependent methyltransferase
MSAPVSIRQERSGAGDWCELDLRCAMCSGEMGALMMGADSAQHQAACSICNFVMLRVEGIWRAIRPSRAGLLAGLLSAYEDVRKAEGRWSDSREFYLSLPWKDTTERFATQWMIRAHSFDFLCGTLLPLCAKALGKRRLRVLDIGAGNCWMSYRLAQIGHRPVAVDLSASRLDGLGAAEHYSAVLESGFPCFQAEMDRLPFAAGQFDAAIFNASFHYSPDYETTLRETLRVLRPGGMIMIVDSPTYRSEADGEAMLREKAEEFLRRYGNDGGNMGGREFLTPERLARLEGTGLRWRRFAPWRGWRWALRPFLARIAKRRRPSQFHIYLGSLAPVEMEKR